MDGAWLDESCICTSQADDAGTFVCHSTSTVNAQLDMDILHTFLILTVVGSCPKGF